MPALNMERIEEIQQLVALVPTDPFPLYGLAMEYRNGGDFAQAAATFGQLMDRFPDYVPQYLMHGQALTALRQPEQAAAVLRQGIAAAERARNLHALGELRSALEALERGADEDEDD